MNANVDLSSFVCYLFRQGSSWLWVWINGVSRLRTETVFEALEPIPLIYCHILLFY